MSSEYIKDIIVKEEYKVEEFNEDLPDNNMFDESRLKCGEVFLDHRGAEFTFVCVLCQHTFSDLSSFGEHIRNSHPFPKKETFVPTFLHDGFIQPKSEPPDEVDPDYSSQDEDESISSTDDVRYEDGDQSEEDNSQSNTEASKKVKGSRRMFCCYSCGKTFVRIDSYRLHYRIHHPDMIAVDNSTKYSSDQTSFVPKVPKEMLCKYCLKTFIDTSAYHNHMENAHHDKLYTCPHCPKNFTRGDKRNYHVKAHKRYKCPNELNCHVKGHKHAKPFKCPHCPKSFPVPDILQHHISTHLKRYACRVCDKKFVRRANLIRHEPIHTKERPFRCNECGLNFKDGSQMDFHMRQHANTNNYKCSYCQKVFICSQDLKEHVLMHRNESQDSCDIKHNIRHVDPLKDELLLPDDVKAEPPEQTETDSEHIDDEKMEETTNMGNYTSPINDAHCEDSNESEEGSSKLQPGTSQQSKNPCETNRPQHSDVLLNEDSSQQPKDMLCQYCLQTFDEIAAYRMHTENAHLDRLFTCPYCPQSFSEKTRRNIHINVHEGKKPYQCPRCPKAFTDPADLGYHVNIHLSIKRFKCRFCDKKFSQSFHLTLHERVHTTEKPFKCSECDKKFTQRSTLVFHMLKHREVKNTKCPHCEKTFTSSKYLKEHIVSHGEDRPFSCDICGQRFKKKRILRDHKISHSDDRKYVCKICAKTFKQRSSVNRHIKKEHSRGSIKTNKE